MNRLCLLLSCLFVMSSLALAEPLSYQKEFELQICPDASQLAPPLHGDPEAAMRLVRELYQLAGPKIGSRFVESCYLLCLGDLRPYGAWNGFMVDPKPGDDEIVDALNRYLVPRGYSLHMHPARAGGKVESFSIHSLEGLDKRTRETRLAWIPRYHRETGWAGYYQWKKDIYKRLPKGGHTFDRVEGVMLGYPDAAVDHQEEMVWSNWPTTVDAYLPESAYYDCGLPVFSLRWQDSTDPGLVALEEEWRNFLGQAYASPIHRALASDQQFVAARRVKLSRDSDKQGFPHGDARYGEYRRLGYTWHSDEKRDLDSQLERWLPAHAGELATALVENSDLQQVAEAAGLPRLRSHHLWSWILRGSCAPGGDAASLFEVFRRHHGDSLLWLYRRELSERASIIERRGALQADPGWDSEPLVQMLNSSYCRSVFEQIPAAEQLAVFQAVEMRRKYAPMEAFLAGGSYDKALRKLRESHPQLWAPSK